MMAKAAGQWLDDPQGTRTPEARILAQRRYYNEGETVEEMASRLVRQVTGWLLAYGPSKPTTLILLVLHEFNGSSDIEIGRYTGMTPPQVSRNLKELLVNDMAVLIVDPVNSRKRRLFLSDSGKVISSKLARARELAGRTAITDVPEDQVTDVIAAVRTTMFWPTFLR